LRAGAKVLEMTEMELRIEHPWQLTSAPFWLDSIATAAPAAEFESLLCELHDSREMRELVIAGLNGAVAHACGKALGDNPHPQGSSTWILWLVGWLLRKGRCERTGSAHTPSQDDVPISGSDDHVS